MVLNKWFGAKCRYQLEVKDQFKPNRQFSRGTNIQAQQRGTDTFRYVAGETPGLYREGPEATGKRTAFRLFSEDNRTQRTHTEARRAPTVTQHGTEMNSAVKLIQITEAGPAHHLSFPLWWPCVFTLRLVFIAL